MLLTPGKMTIQKGQQIFEAGQKMDYLVIVLSGKVWLQNKAFHMIKGPATCIGLLDLEQRVFSSTYTVTEDAEVFVLPITEKEPEHALIEKNLDYRAIMVSSQYKHAAELSRIHSVLTQLGDKLFQYVKEAYGVYLKFYEGTKIHPLIVQGLEQLGPFEGAIEFQEEQLHYYTEAAKVPMSAVKAYYSSSEDMALYDIQKLNEDIHSLVEDCEHVLEYVMKIVDSLVVQKNANLFDCSIMLGKDLRKEGLPYDEWSKYMMSFLDEGHRLAQTIAMNTGIKLPYDIQEMREKIEELSRREMTQEEKKEQEEEQANVVRNLMQLQNSLEQIIAFSEVDPETLVEFRNGMEYFVEAKDRFSVDDEMKRHKRQITDGFFKLFKACYWKRTEVGVLPFPVRLFLEYGFMDERLLSEEQLTMICADRGAEYRNQPCRVYTICEWFDAILMGRKEPSKNEFDEDFKEYIHAMSKRGELDMDEAYAVRDVHWKVEFEMDNMFRVNNRICYGQPSTYVPVLYGEALFGNLEKMILTTKSINDCVEELCEIDYSVFYRETIYSNLEVNVYNFMIPKKVYPDIIIIPVYGSQASMWQEISGKDKKSPGRFMFPAIMGSDIKEAMIKMFGRFHWELCRCIMGMEWNDIRAKSLTSEYMDYIQFYRKNRDLSEEARQKMKLQLQKARNNSREFFLIDYENYMKSEVNGAMKLNKVSRELLGTYVPIKKEIREKLKAQKAFELAFARFERESSKHAQEIEALTRLFQKQKKPIPAEIADAYDYYLNK